MGFLSGLAANGIFGGGSGASGGAALVLPVTQSATPTLDFTQVATDYLITGLAQNVTQILINGTPGPGQECWVKIVDNGTSRGIVWGSNFSSGEEPLPDRTVAGQELEVLFKYNSFTSTLECILVRGGVPRQAVDPDMGLFAPYDPHVMLNAVAPGSANLHLGRYFVRKTGTLRHLNVWNGGTVAGNAMLAIYDTGQATAATRTRLGTSGTVANAGAANSWFELWDPQLFVVRGQQLDVVFQSDSVTSLYGRFNAANINQSLLPSGFLQPSNYGSVNPTVNPYLGAFLANTFGAFPATLPDTGLSGDFPFCIIGFIA